MNIIDELKWRGALNQATDEEGLRELTEEKKIALYCGTTRPVTVYTSAT